MTVEVKVLFAGVVTIELPNSMKPEDARLLAEKMALSRVLATTDNPDAPDEEALEEYQDGCSSIARKRAEQDWDSSKPVGVGGSWTLHQ